MSKPTTIRLDDTTLARAEAVRVRSQVPITTSAVLQEAVRRGLRELEGERATVPRMIDAEFDAYRARIREGLTPLLGEHYAAVAVGKPEAQRVSAERIASDRITHEDFDTIDLVEFLTPSDLGDPELKFKEG